MPNLCSPGKRKIGEILITPLIIYDQLHNIGIIFEVDEGG